LILIEGIAVDNCTVHGIRNELIEANTYVLASAAQQSAIVVDPGSDHDTLKILLEKLNVKKLIVFLTHGHFDHVIGVSKLAEYEPNVYLSVEDVGHLKKNNFYLRALKHEYRCETFEFTDFSEFRNDVFIDVKVHEAPGHTSGSRIFEIGNCFFTGDTLYANRVFSPTVQGSDVAIQSKSIKSIFHNCSGNSILMPGHGRTTTLEKALISNSELQQVLDLK
jgi:hydroxyacylglutathione hydrolase